MGVVGGRSARHRTRRPARRQWLPRQHERAAGGRRPICPCWRSRCGESTRWSRLSPPSCDAFPRFVGPGCFDGFMTLSTYPSCTGNVVSERLEVLFEELAELAGQRNAIEGASWRSWPRWTATGCGALPGARSVAAMVAWKLGTSSTNGPHHRRRRAPAAGVPPLRPRHAGGPAVAGPGRRHRRRAPDGSDEHYAELASAPRSASCAPRSSSNPDPNPTPAAAEPRRSITKTTNDDVHQLEDHPAAR